MKLLPEFFFLKTGVFNKPSGKLKEKKRNINLHTRVSICIMSLLRPTFLYKKRKKTHWALQTGDVTQPILILHCNVHIQYIADNMSCSIKLK